MQLARYFPSTTGRVAAIGRDQQNRRAPLSFPPPFFSSSPEKVMGVNDYIASSAVELAGKYNAHVIIHKLSTLHNAGYSGSDSTANTFRRIRKNLFGILGVRAGWPGEEARQRGRVTLVPVSALDAFPQARVCKQESRQVHIYFILLV